MIGVPVAWHAAQLRPDRFCAVIGLNVPFRARQGETDERDAENRRRGLYQLFYQEPGVAEAEYDRNVRTIV
jgi:pimeloyl-ACP methyl ester carboxylesterase